MSRSLTPAAIERRLTELNGWTLRNGALTREYRFRDFPTAFAFMTACAFEAEKLNHHPDWSNSWATVRIALTTHDAGGITELDFQLATRMESISTAFLTPPPASA